MAAVSWSWFDAFMQTGLVACTALGFALTSLKLPKYGLAANLVAQCFWLYSSYFAWRQAGQIGIFLASIIITLILLYGVLNYWLNLQERWRAWRLRRSGPSDP
jgi:hypothetical protein